MKALNVIVTPRMLKIITGVRVRVNTDNGLKNSLSIKYGSGGSVMELIVF